MRIQKWMKRKVVTFALEGAYDASQDAAALYDKLQNTIVPLFYDNRTGFIDVMLHCMALNGSFFNTHRMFCSSMWRMCTSSDQGEVRG